MAIVKQNRLNSLLNRQPVVYSDFVTNMEVHPVKQDVFRYINENAVKTSIRNLLLTTPGERFFQPTFGGNLRALLFEPFTPTTAAAARDLIKTGIENFEPRARLIDVRVDLDADRNALEVYIVFGVINNEEPVALQLTLDRIR